MVKSGGYRNKHFLRFDWKGINNMKKKILGWLLHHGNTGYKSQYFYNIKNIILSKYGTHFGDDIQYLPGKECYSCDGTGIYNGHYGSNMCYKCAGTGLYRDARLVHLKRIYISDYIFHQPVSSKITSEKPPIGAIIGYITHDKTKNCSKARFILFLLYEKGYLKRWWRETGNGWRLYPFHSFENFIYDMVHFMKKGIKSYPIVNFTDIIKGKFIYKESKNTPISEDDLPF